MSNPFLRGALTTFPNGPLQSTDNITGLVSGTAGALGAVTLSTGGNTVADMVIGPVQIKTGTAAADPAGISSLYVICSEDGSVWDGTLSPNTSGVGQATKAAGGGIRLIQSMVTPASGTTYAFDEFSIWSKLGFVPTQCTVVVYNNSALSYDVSGANFYAKYALDSYT